MLKKIFSVLLAVVVCISFAACSEKPTDSDGTQQVIDQNAAVVVHISINPEFKIHIGNDGNVFAVECLNADAKAVYGKVNVIGKPCTDAVTLVLNETVQQGFLKDDGEIRLAVFVAEEIANQLDAWNNAVMTCVTQVLENNTLDASVSFESRVTKDPAAESSNLNQSAPSGNSDNDVSADHSATVPDANGNTSIKDADGNTIVKGEDGTITVVDENGKMVQVIRVEYTGEVVTQNYDENGNFVSEERGTPGKLEWFAGETIVHTNGSGDKVTMTFGENGQLQFCRTDFADGSAVERQYYEDGTLQQEYDLRADSTYVDISYDTAGNRLTENAKYDDGSVWELTYQPDGSYCGYTYYPDGSVWYNEWDANHRQNLNAQKRIK